MQVQWLLRALSAQVYAAPLLAYHASRSQALCHNTNLRQHQQPLAQRSERCSAAVQQLRSSAASTNALGTALGALLSGCSAASTDVHTSPLPIHVSRGMPFQPGSRRAPLSLQGAHTHMLRVVGRGNDFVLTQHDARIIITILYTRATVASRHRKHLTHGTFLTFPSPALCLPSPKSTTASVVSRYVNVPAVNISVR